MGRQWKSWDAPGKKARRRRRLPLAELPVHHRPMRSAVDAQTTGQTPLQGIPACLLSVDARLERRGKGGARERISVDLRGLGPRLKAYALARGRAPTAAIRHVLVQALDAESAEVSLIASGTGPTTTRTTKVTLRVPAEHAALLALRARRSEMAQGGYVCALLDGESPAPLPLNHDAAIKALMSSTDRLAVLSADLNGFLRAVGHLPNAELQRYRASVVSVVEDARKHLALASALIAEIRASRRGRR